MARLARPRFKISTLLVVMAFCAVLLGWWSDRRQLKIQEWQANREWIRVQHESMKVHERITRMQRNESERITRMRRSESERIAELQRATDPITRAMRRRLAGVTRPIVYSPTIIKGSVDEWWYRQVGELKEEIKSLKKQLETLSLLQR